ncbi:MAG: DUF2851 family protein [Dehalococcoidia bacterium]|nr:DUF2851 family protein [Dehalococcoidia bacterium]
MKITERLISRLWQSHLVRYPVADTGEWLHIIFPGRASNTGGCDFKDAVFGINGRMVTGDVEVHIKSSQWHSHGHHQDPKYNNIVLHVVWQRDSLTPTLLQNGRAIPTICLESFITNTLDELANSPANASSSCPEVGRHSNSSSFNKLLTAAGVKRFKAKTTLFRKALFKDYAGQVIYQGIARALGYAQNAGPCQELAQRLPASKLIINGKPTDGFYQQALLLGHAGLLPSQRHRPVKDREAAKLEKIWRSIGTTCTMKEADWCFFRVRPDNFPTRRLIALGCLMSRYHKSGLLQGILRLVKETPSKTEHLRLETGLAVASHGYWQNHFDFGISTSRASALIGYEKAAAIVINAVLPFTAAWAELDSDSKLKKRAAEIYQHYPGTGDNELTRYMKQLLRLRPDIRLSACQQQGLIHLFSTYCRCRHCSQCPVALSPS